MAPTTAGEKEVGRAGAPEPPRPPLPRDQLSPWSPATPCGRVGVELAEEDLLLQAVHGRTRCAHNAPRCVGHRIPAQGVYPSVLLTWPPGPTLEPVRTAGRSPLRRYCKASLGDRSGVYLAGEFLFGRSEFPAPALTAITGRGSFGNPAAVQVLIWVGLCLSYVSARRFGFLIQIVALHPQSAGWPRTPRKHPPGAPIRRPRTASADAPASGCSTSGCRTRHCAQSRG